MRRQASESSQWHIALCPHRHIADRPASPPSPRRSADQTLMRHLVTTLPARASGHTRIASYCSWRAKRTAPDAPQPYGAVSSPQPYHSGQNSRSPSCRKAPFPRPFGGWWSTRSPSPVTTPPWGVSTATSPVPGSRPGCLAVVPSDGSRHNEGEDARSSASADRRLPPFCGPISGPPQRRPHLSGH